MNDDITEPLRRRAISIHQRSYLSIYFSVFREAVPLLTTRNNYACKRNCVQRFIRRHLSAFLSIESIASTIRLFIFLMTMVLHNRKAGFYKAFLIPFCVVKLIARFESNCRTGSIVYSPCNILTGYSN